MKITIDTVNKIIEVHEETNLGELIESIYSLLGDFIKDYKIKPVVKLEKTIEYVPFYNPPYNPFNDWITQPVWIVTTDEQNKYLVDYNNTGASPDIMLHTTMENLNDIMPNINLGEKTNFKDIIANFQS